MTRLNGHAILDRPRLDIEDVAMEHAAYLRALGETPEDVCQAIFRQYPEIKAAAPRGEFGWDHAIGIIGAAFRRVRGGKW